MNLVKLVACFFGIAIPMLIFASSIVAPFKKQEFFLVVWTRDGAQLMYLGITLLGSYGLTTGINYQIRNIKISLDMITVGLLGFCYCAMSLSFVQEPGYQQYLPILNMVVNGSGFVFLVGLLAPYIREELYPHEH